VGTSVAVRRAYPLAAFVKLGSGADRAWGKVRTRRGRTGIRIAVLVERSRERIES
jgi:hypothetical protein